MTKFFYGIASSLTVLAAFIITPYSLSFFHAPTVPEELK
ncbi:cyclic lactone autoinducer peptide [Aneurinibacillus aneurinilyticus]|nr:cyclic lactone autoinducer peptide [Aneurinibacillus aneurinilyticus]MED0726101.1 cyclic lactone autoinducer peptide [Aneurinibacillus aneurinilyticus]MED0730420.1 cyclic lactone autoinducer peptide [Aneurinibacillus aneurinilyticus]MED0739152.1 cyclic lactone autoinducer peptide [Aneurinibacillus aneurinilyticus]